MTAAGGERCLGRPILYAINVNSLAKPHVREQLYADLMSYHIDIAIISETRLKKHHSDEICALEGYHIHRRDRRGRSGAGVAIYVRDESQCNICHKHGIEDDLELLWIKMETDCHTAIVGALYHPQSRATTQIGFMTM